MFYRTAKVHNLGKGEGLDELTMRPVISNIQRATYETTKYLNSMLLASLGKSGRGLFNTETFIKDIKVQRIPDCYQMISFEVKSLFTNVSFLNETIDIILRKFYDENEIVTNIPRSILKELSYLCNKYVHFKFNGE